MLFERKDLVMDYIEKMEASIKEKIRIRVAMLEAEIETLRKNQRANELYYGLGGPYRRGKKFVL